MISPGILILAGLLATALIVLCACWVAGDES